MTVAQFVEQLLNTIVKVDPVAVGWPIIVQETSSPTLVYVDRENKRVVCHLQKEKEKP